MMKHILTAGLIAVVSLTALAQHLDWSGDQTIFGTTANEYQPVVSVTPVSGLLRVACVSGISQVTSKVSTDQSASWSAASGWDSCASVPILALSTDDQYGFAFLSEHDGSRKTLFRFSGAANNWLGARRVDLGAEQTGRVLANAITTDFAMSPGAPRIDVCWMEEDAGIISGWFAQSRDRGLSVLSAHEVFATVTSMPDSDMSMAVVDAGGHERIIVAATIDRPGSIPPAISVFGSDDDGVTWSSTLVDSSAWQQREPSLACASSTVLLAFASRASSDARQDIYFTYSPNGGDDFAPVYVIADSVADEHTPRVVIDAVAGVFYVFYLIGSVTEEPATVYMRMGSLSAPWIIGSAVMISEPGGALSGHGLSVSGGPNGIAAVWTGRFALGDEDIHFDASWRGASVRDQGALPPSDLHLGPAYPNPFNGVTVLPLEGGSKVPCTILITDVLGREIMRKHLPMSALGEQRIRLDLSESPSGLYFVRIAEAVGKAQRIVLVR